MIPLIKIQKAIANYFKTDLDFMFQNSRKADVIYQRQLFYYFSWRFNKGDMSLNMIGNYGLKRDHATVLHSYNKIIDLMPFDRKLREDVEALELQLVGKQIDDYRERIKKLNNKLINEVGMTIEELDKLWTSAIEELQIRVSKN